MEFPACISKEAGWYYLEEDGRIFAAFNCLLPHYMNILLALRVENGFDIHVQ